MNELRRIMHIEDDPSIQDVARVALEIVGKFEVCTCGSGQEALQRFAGFDPQLVLLDVMMPGMDGPTTLKQLQQQFGKPIAFALQNTRLQIWMLAHSMLGKFVQDVLMEHGAIGHQKQLLKLVVVVSALLEL